MSEFPRTEVGGVSLSRLVAGSNWFLGFSHQTHAKTCWIQAYQTRQRIADVLEVFLREGINVTMSPLSPLMAEAIGDAQDRTGSKLHWICTPSPKLTPEGPDWDDTARSFDEAAEHEPTYCWPHQCFTDRLYDGLTGTIRHMDRACRMIRQRGMIPGLSSHNPAVIVTADKTKLDVASYICLYNAAGFMMQTEIDWVQKVIHDAAKPVTTIKPLAAGRLMPYVGLPFVWSTLRDCDLVTVGTVTPDEAREVIEISLATLQRRPADVELQMTRSKQTLVTK